MKPAATGTLLAVLLSLCSSGEARATGALFGRQINSTAIYQSMEIRTYDAQVSIHDQFAVTHVDQRCFNNLRATVEATFIFPLPDGAFITYFAYWFNGVKYVAQIREREAAQKTYDSLVKRMIDPALLVDLGNNVFKLNVAPVHANTELRFEITYVELVTQRSGNSDYRFILKTTGLSPVPLQRVSVTVDAVTDRSFDTLELVATGNTPATAITRVDSGRYHIVFGDEAYVPSSDLVVRYRTRHNPFDAQTISYRSAATDSIGPDGYFGMWVTVPDSLDGSVRTGRSIVFTADVSSSMIGERLEGLKEALGVFLDGLIPTDRFNIVIFSTNVNTFQPDLVAATPETIGAARKFVSELGASGLTNIDEALAQSLAMTFGERQADNILIFMTDGVPTWGETDAGAIVDSCVARNASRVRILPFGLGTDLSTALLDAIAARNGGYATYIATGVGFAESIRSFFRRVTMPPVSDIYVTIDGLNAYDRVPALPQTVEAGTQIVQFGRYTGGGTYPISGSARVDQTQIGLESTGYFVDVADGDRAIALLWAREKINDLLRQIALYGEKKELIDAVVFLSVRYGILTPYTALYADPNASDVHDRVIATRLAVEYIAPNPMSERTVIVWQMPDGISRSAKIEVLDLSGRIVRTLLNTNEEPGRHATEWDGRNDSGELVPSGTYFIRMTVGSVKQTYVIAVVR